jgi:hypothetical protein
MAEFVTGPKKYLALNTDWQTALAMVAVFIISALMGSGTAWMTLHGTFTLPSNPWLTLALLASGIYFAIVIRERLFRVAVFVFAVGPAIRIALWMVHASAQTLLINEVFVRWMHTGLYLAGCVYAVCWFRGRIVYV